MEGPKPARGQEILAASELGRRIFHPDSSAPTGARAAAPPPDTVRENMRIFTDGDRVVSLVVMNYRPVVLLGTPHLVCTFGGVCTDPDYRGHGLATQLLEDCRRKAIADGADLVLISGTRGLYRHSGYSPVGPLNICKVARASLPPAPPGSVPCVLRTAVPGDLAALMQMQVAEPVRFVRTPEELLRLVSSTRVLNGRGQTLVICSHEGGKPLAWITCLIGGRGRERVPSNSTRILEVAGSRWAILNALPALMDRQEVDEVELEYGAWDHEFGRMAADLGWPSEPRPFRGTVGVIAPGRFWDASAGMFREQLGNERFERLALSADDGGIRITCGDECLQLKDWTAFTQLVFTHPAKRHELELALPAESELARAFGEIFPMPIVNYGLNYF
jgi:GNAT superfamily N-acetyltransferase